MFIILLNYSFSDIFVFFTHHIFIDTVVSLLNKYTNLFKIIKAKLECSWVSEIKILLILKSISSIGKQFFFTNTLKIFKERQIVIFKVVN